MLVRFIIPQMYRQRKAHWDNVKEFSEAGFWSAAELIVANYLGHATLVREFRYPDQPKVIPSFIAIEITAETRNDLIALRKQVEREIASWVNHVGAIETKDRYSVQIELD